MGVRLRSGEYEGGHRMKIERGYTVKVYYNATSDWEAGSIHIFLRHATGLDRGRQASAQAYLRTVFMAPRLKNVVRPVS